MSDEKYVPPAGADSDVSSDEDEDLAGGDALVSGDEEVIATAVSSSTSDSPRHRRKIRRCTVSPAVPVVKKRLPGMDLSDLESPSHKYFKTFRGVWEDKVSGEEIRASRPRYRVRTPKVPPSSALSTLARRLLLLLPLRCLRLPLLRLLFLRMAPSSIL